MSRPKARPGLSFEALEQRIMLSSVSIEADSELVLLEGVDTLLQFAEVVLGDQTAGVGTFAAQKLAPLTLFADALETIGDDISTYFANTDAPTYEDLVLNSDALIALGTGEQGFSIVFDESDLAALLGNGNEWQNVSFDLSGLEVSTSGSTGLLSDYVDINAQVDGTITLTEFDFAVDLVVTDDSDGLFRSIEFRFNDQNPLRVALSITQGMDDESTLDANVGILGANTTITNLNVQIASEQASSLASRSYSSSDLLALQPNQVLTFDTQDTQDNTLSLTARIEGVLDGVTLAEAELDVSDDDIADGTLPDAVLSSLSGDFEAAANSFRSLTPTSLLTALEQTQSAFQDLFTSEALNLTLPFTNGTTAAELIDFSSIYEDTVLSRILLPANDGTGGTSENLAFTTLQQFAELINPTGELIFTPSNGDDPAEISFKLAFDATVGLGDDNSIVFALDEAIGDLGPLQLDASVSPSLSTKLEAMFDVGVLLQKPGATVEFTGTTELSTLNAGRGIGLGSGDDGEDDFVVTLSSGNAFRVDVDLLADSTIQGLIDVFEQARVAAAGANAGDTEWQFEIKLDDDATGLVAVDSSTTDGSGTFRITRTVSGAAPGDSTEFFTSLIGLQLGLLGVGTLKDDGTQVISSGQLHGKTFADNIFLSTDSVEPMLRLTFDLAAEDLNLSTSLGPLELSIENGRGVYTANTVLSIADPGEDQEADNRLSLAEFIGIRDDLVFSLTAGDEVTRVDTDGDGDGYGGILTVEVAPTMSGGDSTTLYIPYFVTSNNFGLSEASLVSSQMNLFLDLLGLGGDPIQVGSETIRFGSTDGKLNVSLADGIAREVTLKKSTDALELLKSSGVVDFLSTQLQAQVPGILDLVVPDSLATAVSGIVDALNSIEQYISQNGGTVVEAVDQIQQAILDGTTGSLDSLLQAALNAINSNAVQPYLDMSAGQLGIAADVSGFVARPSSLNGAGTIELPVAFDSGIDVTSWLNFPGVDLGAIPEIVISLPDLSLEKFSLPGSFSIGPTDLFGAIPEFLALRDLPITALVRAFQSGLDILQSIDGFGDLPFFNTTLPLLDLNVGQLLNIGDVFGDVLVELEASPIDGLGLLDEILEDILGIPENVTLDSNGPGTNPILPAEVISFFPEFNFKDDGTAITFEVTPDGSGSPVTIDLSDPAAFAGTGALRLNGRSYETLREFLRSSVVQGDHPTVELSLDTRVPGKTALRLDTSLFIGDVSNGGTPTLGFGFDVDPLTADSSILIDLENLLGTDEEPLFDASLFGGSGSVNVDLLGQVDFAIGIDLDAFTTATENRIQSSTFLYEFDPSDEYDYIYETADARPGTRLSVLTRVNEASLGFGASLGPAGADVTGDITVARSLDPLDADEFAVFSVGLRDSRDGTSDERIFVRDLVADLGGSEIGANDFVFGASGALEFSGTLGLSGDALQAQLIGKIQDLSFVTTELNNLISSPDPVTGQDLATLVFQAVNFSDSNITGLTDISDVFSNLALDLKGLAGAWDGIFGGVVDLFDDSLFSADLPFVGTSLKEAAGADGLFLETIRDAISPVADGSVFGVTQIQGEIFNVFGPDKLAWLQDLSGDGTVTTDDIVVETVKVGPVITEYIVKFSLLSRFEANIGADFKVGVDGLGFDLDTDATFGVEFLLDFAAGVSLEDGVFIKTDETRADISIDVRPTLDAEGSLGLLRVNALVDEPAEAVLVSENDDDAKLIIRRIDGTPFDGEFFRVRVLKTADQSGSVVFDSYSGNAGSLEIRLGADDSTLADLEALLLNPDSYSGAFLFGSDPFSGARFALERVGDGTASILGAAAQNNDYAIAVANGFAGVFSATFADPSNPMDQKLTLVEIARSNSVSDLIKFTSNAQASFNLNLDASVNLGDDVTLLPPIEAGLGLVWSYDPLSDDEVQLPTVTLSDVTLDAGIFFDGYVRDIFGRVDSVLAPIKQVTDILGQRVPVLSELSGSTVTLLDIARLQGGRVDQAIKFINAAGDLAVIAGAIDGIISEFDDNPALNDGKLNLGSAIFNGATGEFEFDGLAGDINQVIDNINLAITTAAMSSSGGQSAAEFFVVNGAASEDGLDAQFPILDPRNVFGILSGKTVDLFGLELPKFVFDFEISKFFPLPALPAIGIEISGGIGATIDVSFGYDSFGLQKYLVSEQYEDLFDGFFISDRARANGTGADINELVLTGRLTAAAAVDAGIVSAQVGGGLFATINFNLNDPDGDGKVRGGELLANVRLGEQDNNGPIHVFDISGGIDARLFYEITYDLLFVSGTESDTIAEVELISFEIPRPDPISTEPTLFTRNGNELTFLTTNGDDEFVIVGVGDVVNGLQDVRIEALGSSQLVEGVSKVIGYGGLGDDTFDASDGVLIEVEFRGDDGNDTIRSSDYVDSDPMGNGNQLSGGEGDDTIIGGLGRDTILGGGGNDALYGNRGDDIIDGGAGNDSISGGSGNDVLKGDEDDDTILGGTGDDSIEGGVGDDLIDGESGNDTIHAGDGDDTVDGGLGADTIYGEAGRDTIRGGIGADVIRGGDDEDDLFGQSGADEVFGDGGQDVIRGGTGQDKLYGGFGDDQLYANTENAPEPDGALGDTLVGGAGNDLIRGTGAADTIFGDDEDQERATDGVDDIQGFGGDDSINAGGGDDVQVFGGDGDDDIIGGSGNDVLDGGDGDDLLVGGIGSDILYGRTGRDVLIGDDAELGEADNLVNRGRFAKLDGSAVTNPADLLPEEPSDPMLPDAIDDLNESTIGDSDTLYGGEDTDWLFGGAKPDTLLGGDGADYIAAGEGDDVAVSGGLGRDYVRGNTGDDELHGDEGNDVLEGNDGNDRLYGDAFDNGNATAVPEDQRQIIQGGAGHDILFAWAGDSGAAERDLVGEFIYGNSGNDQLFGSQRRDWLDGGSGNDAIFGDILTGSFYTFVDNVVSSQTGADDTIVGGSGEDQIFAGGGDDEVYGGENSDFIDGQAGADTLVGGQGNDIFVAPVATDDAFALMDVMQGDGADTPGGMIVDSPATDILAILGTDQSELIAIADDGSGRLRIRFDTIVNGVVVPTGARVVPIDISSDGSSSIEQLQIAGLGGDDVIGFAGTDIPELGGILDLLVGETALDITAFGGAGPDFNTKFDGNTGNDILVGGIGRDALDGGSGSDTLYGLGANDRLAGDFGEGSINDVDVMYAGQGNDDLIGGQGRNLMVAWSSAPVKNPATIDPSLGDFPAWALYDPDSVPDPFGVFVAGDEREDTGVNRMLGGQNDDLLFGGTGLDFLYGAGGDDRLHKVDGQRFESGDGGVGESDWLDYARSNDQVWYYAGTELEDHIQVKLVTEDGVQQGRHIIIRETFNDDGSLASVDVDLNLSFDSDAFASSQVVLLDAVERLQALQEQRANNPTATDRRVAVEADEVDVLEATLLANLLPPEGDFLAILIDALGENDVIDVGQTVQKTVWIDAGDGNDFVTVQSGGGILLDQAELPGPNSSSGRNDFMSTAFGLGEIIPDTAFSGLTLHDPLDVDYYSFTLGSDLGSDIDNVRLHLASTIELSQIEFELLEIVDTPNGPVDNVIGSGSNVGSLLEISADLQANTTYFIRVAASERTVGLYDLAIVLIFEGGRFDEIVFLGSDSPDERRDVVIGGSGNDRLAGGDGADWIFGGEGSDVLIGGTDRQASDLLFGGSGDDTFQISVSALPLLASDGGTLFERQFATILPTISDRFDGGEGNDRVLFFGEQLVDPLGRVVGVDDYVTIAYDTTLFRYGIATLVPELGLDSDLNPVTNYLYKPLFTDPSTGDIIYDTSEFLIHYQFFTTNSIEQFAAELGDGDDTFRADVGFNSEDGVGGANVLPGLLGEWGLAIGDNAAGGELLDLFVSGDAGRDVIFGGPGNDLLIGDRANAAGGQEADIIAGGLGNDRIFGNGGDDRLYGEDYSGDPVLLGTPTLLDDGLEALAAVRRAVFINPSIDLAAGSTQSFDLNGMGSLSDGFVIEAPDGERVISAQVIGDFSGDGELDLLISTEDFSYVLLRPGSFAESQAFLDRLSTFNDIDSFGDGSIASYANFIIDHSVFGTPARTFGDFNGAGRGTDDEAPADDLVFVKFDPAVGTDIHIIYGGDLDFMLPPDAVSVFDLPKLWDNLNVVDERLQRIALSIHDLDPGEAGLNVDVANFSGGALDELIVTSGDATRTLSTFDIDGEVTYQFRFGSGTLQDYDFRDYIQTATLQGAQYGLHDEVGSDRWVYRFDGSSYAPIPRMTNVNGQNVNFDIAYDIVASDSYLWISAFDINTNQFGLLRYDPNANSLEYIRFDERVLANGIRHAFLDSGFSQFAGAEMRGAFRGLEATDEYLYFQAPAVYRDDWLPGDSFAGLPVHGYLFRMKHSINVSAQQTGDLQAVAWIEPDVTSTFIPEISFTRRAASGPNAVFFISRVLRDDIAEISRPAQNRDAPVINNDIYLFNDDVDPVFDNTSDQELDEFQKRLRESIVSGSGSTSINLQLRSLNFDHENHVVINMNSVGSRPAGVSVLKQDLLTRDAQAVGANWLDYIVPSVNGSTEIRDWARYELVIVDEYFYGYNRIAGQEGHELYRFEAASIGDDPTSDVGAGVAATRIGLPGYIDSLWELGRPVELPRSVLGNSGLFINVERDPDFPAAGRVLFIGETGSRAYEIPDAVEYVRYATPNGIFALSDRVTDNRGLYNQAHLIMPANYGYVYANTFGDRLTPEIDDLTGSDRTYTLRNEFDTARFFISNSAEFEFASIGDMNGDNNDDIAWTVWYSVGATEFGFNGVFVAAQSPGNIDLNNDQFFATDNGRSENVFALGDINQDGFNDIAVWHESWLRLHLGADDLVGTSQLQWVDWTGDVEDVQVKGGDFDGDGYGDVLINLVRPSGANELRFLSRAVDSIGLGSPIDFTSLKLIPTSDVTGALKLSTSSYSVDFNRDGIEDLIAFAVTDSGETGRVYPILGQLAVTEDISGPVLGLGNYSVPGVGLIYRADLGPANFRNDNELFSLSAGSSQLFQVKTVADGLDIRLVYQSVDSPRLQFLDSSGRELADTSDPFRSGLDLLAAGTYYIKITAGASQVDFALSLSGLGLQSPGDIDSSRESQDADIIFGGDGDDLIVGGSDLDRLYGNDGTNTFADATSSEVADELALGTGSPGELPSYGAQESESALTFELVASADPSSDLGLSEIVLSEIEGATRAINELYNLAFPKQLHTAISATIVNAAGEIVSQSDSRLNIVIPNDGIYRIRFLRIGAGNIIDEAILTVTNVAPELSVFFGDEQTELTFISNEAQVTVPYGPQDTISFSANVIDPGMDRLEVVWRIYDADGTEILETVSGDYFEPLLSMPGRYRVELEVSDEITTVSRFIILDAVPVAIAVVVSDVVFEGREALFTATQFDGSPFEPSLDTSREFRWEVLDEFGVSVLSEQVVTANPEFSWTPTDDGNYFIRVVVTETTDDQTVIGLESAGTPFVVEDILPELIFPQSGLVLLQEDVQTADLGVRIADIGNGANDVFDVEITVFYVDFRTGADLEASDTVNDVSELNDLPSFVRQVLALSGDFTIRVAVMVDGVMVTGGEFAVTVTNDVPGIDINPFLRGDGTAAEGELVEYTALVTNIEDGLVFVSWDVFNENDELVYSQEGETLKTSFVDSGLYTIVVTATDERGASNSTQVELVVTNGAPVIQSVDQSGPARIGDIVEYVVRVNDWFDDDLRVTLNFGNGIEYLGVPDLISSVSSLGIQQTVFRIRFVWTGQPQQIAEVIAADEDGASDRVFLLTSWDQETSSSRVVRGLDDGMPLLETSLLLDPGVEVTTPMAISMPIVNSDTVDNRLYSSIADYQLEPPTSVESSEENSEVAIYQSRLETGLQSDIWKK